MLLYKLENGWPTAVLDSDFSGTAPAGTMAFADWDAVAAYQAANPDKAPAQQAVDPVPPEVPAWKVKLALRRRGKFGLMQAGIDALTGPNALMVQSRWEYGGTLPRDGDTVNELCLTALGYTPAQTDDLFREADRIPD